MDIRITVNGELLTVTTPAERPLLDVLREDLHLTGTKFGCGEGQCGACTVLVDGKPLRSCSTPASKAHGKSITTVEGLAKDDTLHYVQQAFVDVHASQCGYCTPGMILTTAALLERNAAPSDADILNALNGHLCRCCGYPDILDAVRKAATQRTEAKAS
jgi:aerobic-type carbon monoxide dehydrogenase small subunit (CoxS/CutS family)